MQMRGDEDNGADNGKGRVKRLKLTNQEKRKVERLLRKSRRQDRKRRKGKR